MKKKYIQFAIDNGYSKLNDDWKIKTDIQTQEKNDNEQVYLDETLHGTFIFYGCCDVGCDIVSLKDIITSKVFIEAIYKGIYKETKDKHIKVGNELVYNDLENILNSITTQQAIAIRDGKLEEFIEDILKK